MNLDNKCPVHGNYWGTYCGQCFAEENRRKRLEHESLQLQKEQLEFLKDQANSARYSAQFPNPNGSTGEERLAELASMSRPPLFAEVDTGRTKENQKLGKFAKTVLFISHLLFSFINTAVLFAALEAGSFIKTTKKMSDMQGTSFLAVAIGITIWAYSKSKSDGFKKGIFLQIGLLIAFFVLGLALKK